MSLYRCHQLRAWPEETLHPSLYPFFILLLPYHSSHVSKPSEVWEAQDTHISACRETRELYEQFAADNNTFLEREGEGCVWSGHAMGSWDDTAVLVSGIGSLPPKDKDSYYPGVQAQAQPYCQSLARTLVLLLKYFWVHDSFQCIRIYELAWETCTSWETF